MTSQADAARGDGTDLRKEVPPLLAPRPRWEAADTVIAASAALVAIIVGTFVLLCFQGYASTIEGAKVRAQAAADVVAEETSWLVASSLALLDGVESYLENTAAGAGTGAGIAAEFEAVTAPIPARLTLGIYDASGAVVPDASAGGVPRSIAATDYFGTLAEGAEWSLSAQGANAETGEPTFAVTKRLERNGSFSGVAMVVVDAGVLERLAEPQDLGPGSTISIIRSDGWVVARDPPLPEPLDVSGAPVFQELRGLDAGAYESEASPADGVARIVSFRRVGDLGYVAVASIATETALAGLWNSIWIVSLLIAPIAIALLAGSFITARLLRRTQSTSRSLAAALEHNEILFREIHHRVKNNLQSVSALMQLQPIPRAVRADMSQRIAAMSAVHEHIYRSETFSKVRVKDYLHTLIENIRAGHDPGVEVIEEIEDVAVDKDAATPLGLIVNEVVSNCFKHAFADGRRGTVTITLKGLGDGRAKLTVRDNGVGFDPEVPAKGIGRRLIRGFTGQLQGESSHSSDASGSVFTLIFALAK